MNIIGKENGGMLVIRTHELMLPGSHRAMVFPVNTFTGPQVQQLYNDPHERHTVLLLHTDADITKHNIAVMCEMSYPNVSNVEVIVNVSAKERVHIYDSVKGDDGREYAKKFEMVSYALAKPEESYEMVNKVLQWIADSGEKDMYEEVRMLDKPTQVADYMLNIMFANDQKAINEWVETIPTSKRLKGVIMTIDGANDNKNDGLRSGNKDVKELIELFRKTDLNTKAYSEVHAALKQLCGMSQSSSEYSGLYRYVAFALNLPWGKFTTDAEIVEVERTLDDSHYGMDKAKERLMEFLAIKKLNPESKGMILLLDGPPGTGKTTLAKAFAKALGRECVRISMGGCSDASFIKGHSRTYIGAKHGRILDAMEQAKTMNPVIILDEVEKLTVGAHGDPDAALLEVLDPVQNNQFTDTYANFDFDLSKVIFIATSNEADHISPAVFDRMEYIECEGYTLAEKVMIAEKYTIPRINEDLGTAGYKVPKAMIKYLINSYTREPGVRTLEKSLNSVLRKVAIETAKGNALKITKKMINKRLGQPYEELKPFEHDMPGVVTGMYYSTGGGGCLDIEAIVTNYDGSGGLTFTGQPGEVMTESISLVHAHMATFQEVYGLNEIDLKCVDLHVHMPDGATPKDGPSAGAAYALLFGSIAFNKPVIPGLAMTGECTLTGRITAIGGLDQKCAGAIRMGMTDIILPEQNRREYNELPKYVKKGARYHFVSTVEEVLQIGLGLDNEEDVACA